MSAPASPLVVQVVHRLDVGGLENGVVNLVNRIAPERYRNAIVCLSGYGADFVKRIRRADVPVLSLDKRPGKDLPMYWRMSRVLRRLKPAVVHTRNLGTVDMQWVAAAAGVPGRVHGEHGWEASDPQGRNPKSLRIRRACRPAIQRYVPMSQDLARWLERDVGVAPACIRQLYNGVDTQVFRPDGPLPVDLPWPPSGSSGAPVVVGTVGRLDPVKDQATLLHAARRWIERNPQHADRLRVVIAGDGPLRKTLEGLAGELGIGRQVWFAGRRDDTAAILRSLDVFVLPSINEGISNTILEAMASGRPVVATRVGGTPEIVADGVTGTLFRQGDVDALESLLSGYLADPALRQRHGVAGRERADYSFSMHAMVDGYLSLYDEVTGRGAPRQAPGDRKFMNKDSQ